MPSSKGAVNIAQVEQLVRAAGEKLVELWPGRNTGHELSIQRKSDGTMVTEADLASNAILTAGLKKLFPQDYIFSEEEADAAAYAASENAWIIDPLDGTEIYSRGENYFAVFLARRVGEKITVGIMYYPALGTLLSAERGKGAAVNGVPVHVSAEKALKAHSVCIEGLSLAPHPHLCESKQYPVGTTAFESLCRGKIDGVIVRFKSGTFYPWDFAPGSLIIEESGGKVTDEAGKPIVMRTCPVQCRYFVASNGTLHPEVLSIIPR